jgi:CRP-like cAMP-binding protein
MKSRSLPVTLEILPRDAATLKKRVPPTKYLAGQVLFYRGHLPYGVLIVYSGRADLRLRESDQKAPIRVGPNTVVGLPYVLNEEPYPLTAIVVEDLEASFIEKTLLSAWAKEKNSLFSHLK